MAGYLFLFNDISSLKKSAKTGLYSTILRPPFWRLHHEATFADYVTMKPGDNVYFFHDRKIYGIGKLIQIQFDSKFLNFPTAGEPSMPEYNLIKKQLLEDTGDDSLKKRVVCVFEPSPYFFSEGVDMDDVLLSNPGSFRMLRVLWKRSFIKFEDEENQAFKNIILKRNQHTLANPATFGTFPFEPESHNQIKEKITSDYAITNGVKNVLNSLNNGSKLRHEMAIELGLLHQLAINDPMTVDVFGNWDYLSHQVVASPFKPVDYMDKMDIFGYSYISGHRPSRNKYLIIEIKKDRTELQDVDQLMRYVDWVKDEYCFGDYSMIKAFLLYFDFNKEIVQRIKNIGIRNYTIGVRPTRSESWSDISLVSYRYNQKEKRLDLNKDWSSISTF